MAQERIDSRYTPMQNSRGGLMYNTCAVETENSENSMNNAPAGGMGDRRNSASTQWMDDGGMKTIGFTSPPPIDFDTEEMRGSMQNILSKKRWRIRGY